MPDVWARVAETPGELAGPAGNHRKMTDTERFDLAVRHIVGKRLTYKELTGEVPETTMPAIPFVYCPFYQHQGLSLRRRGSDLLEHFRFMV